MNHLGEKTILALLGSMSDEARRSVAHLLACPLCRRKGSGAARGVEIDPLYTTVLPAHDALWGRVERVRARVAEARQQDAQEAIRLFGELVDVPEEERRRAVEREPRFHSPSLGRLLIEASLAAVEDDPRRSEALAELATEIAVRCDARRFGEEALTLVQACAWAQIGEARRRLGDLAGAEAALRRARVEADLAPLHGLERAVFCRGLAQLRHDQGRTDEALALSARAISLYEEQGEWQDLAAALAEQGWMILEEDPVSALTPFEAALSLIEERIRPAEALRIRQGMARAYAEIGWKEEARGIVQDGTALYELLPGLVPVLRAIGQEAAVAERLGRHREAVEKLTYVAHGLLEAGAPYDAAVYALRLGRVLAAQGNASALDRLGRDAAPLLVSETIPPRIRTLLSFVFTFALRGHPRGEELLEQAAGFLERARHNPELPFLPHPEPLRTVSWERLPRDVRQRICAVAGAREGVADRSGAEVEPAVREVLAWVSELEYRTWILFDGPVD